VHWVQSQVPLGIVRDAEFGGKKAKACCWMHGPGFGDQREGGSARVRLGPWSCKEPGFNFDVCLKLGNVRW